MKGRFFFSNTKSTKLTEITPILEEIIIPSDGSENEGFFASLPKEIFFEIVILLDAKTLALFSLTSKTLHNRIAASPLNQHKQVYHDKNKLYKQYQTLMQQIDMERPNPCFKILSIPIIGHTLFFTFTTAFFESMVAGIIKLAGKDLSDMLTGTGLLMTVTFAVMPCLTTAFLFCCCSTGSCCKYSPADKRQLSKVAELEKEANAILSIIR